MELIREFSDEYTDYLRDESRIIGHAKSISFPKSEEEMIDVIKYCYENDILINIQGARTGLAGGASPLGGNVLNLGRMSKILGLRYDEEQDKYYMRIQPGVLLLQVRKALENKSFNIQGWSEESIAVLNRIKPGELFFSPDPTEPTASIGGMAACNASGSRSLLYGPTRDHINAIRVILANGEVTELRRGVHKVNGKDFVFPLESGGEFVGRLPDMESPNTKDAGFFIHDNMELIDLFLGSQGTLGIISELEICLMDAPKLMWGVTAFFPDDYTSINYVRVLRGEQLPGMPVFKHKPAAIEFFDKQTLDMVLRQKEITPAFQQLQELPEVYSSAIYVEFNDSDSDNFWPVLKELGKVIEAVGGNPDDTWVADGPLELEKLLFFRHTVPETVNLIVDEKRKKEPTITILSADMAVPDDCIVKVYDMYHNDLKNKTKEWIIFGHIGENHYHPDIFPNNKEEYEAGHEIFKDWARQVRDMGGTITAEHGAGKIKKELARIMYGDENVEKLRAFKTSLDPKYLLSPGNII